MFLLVPWSPWSAYWKSCFGNNVPREMLNVADTSKRIDDWGETSSGRRQKAARSDRCLHFVAEPSSATRRGAAKNWKLLQLGYYKKRSVFLGIDLFTWIQNLFLSISLLWHSIKRAFKCSWMQHWYFFAEGNIRNALYHTQRSKYHNNCYL